MNFKQLLSDLFRSLPLNIDGRFLSLRFVDRNNAIVCYSTELGDIKPILTVEDKDAFVVTRCMLELSSAFSKEDILNACAKNTDVLYNPDDLTRVVRDVDLIFSTLPSSIVHSGGRMKLRGEGKKFELRVDVDASAGHLSWLVQYVHSDSDAIVVSFALNGADDDADHWHQYLLKHDDLVWGMEHEFSLSIFERGPFQISFLQPAPMLVSDNLKPFMVEILGNDLGVPIERARELFRILEGAPFDGKMSPASRMNKAYEHVSAHCENVNELFYIAWACGNRIGMSPRGWV